MIFLFTFLRVTNLWFKSVRMCDVKGTQGDCSKYKYYNRIYNGAYKCSIIYYNRIYYNGAYKCSIGSNITVYMERLEKTNTNRYALLPIRYRYRCGQALKVIKTKKMWV